MAEQDLSFDLSKSPFFRDSGNKVEAPPSSAPAPVSSSKPEPAQPTVDTGDDIQKSVIAKGAQGLAGTALGGAGSVESFFAQDVPTAIRDVSSWGLKKAGVISPETHERVTSAPLYSNQTEEQKQGLAAPITGLPTYKDVVEKIKKHAPEAGADWASHEPQTPAGKVLGAGAEFAAQGIPGAARNALGRVVTSSMAGSGGELAALGVKDNPDVEPYVRLTGALGGAGIGGAGSALAGKVFNTVRAAALPTGVAERELADALARDVSRKQANLALLGQEGVTLADIGGPETRKILERSGAKSAKNEPFIAAYNQHLAERAAETGTRITDHLTSAFGQPINAGQLTKELEKAGAKSRNDIYALLSKNPAASAIDHTQFGELINRPIMRSAMKSAEDNAANFPNWNIVSPKGGATPAQGNLAYWDQVKRELDAKIRSSTDPVERQAAIQAKTKLVGTLDKSVSGYENARSAAADTFRAESAPEAGMNFFKNIDSMKLQEAKDAYQKFSPEQQRLFGMGFSQQIQDQVQTNKLPAIAKKFATDDIFRQKAKLALGDQYAALEAKVTTENLASKIKDLKFLENQNPSANFGLNSVLGAAGGAGLEGFLTGQFFGPAGALTGAGLGAAKSIASMIGNAADRRVAEKLIPMAFSPDPKVMKQFAEALQESSQARSIMKEIAEQFDRKTATATTAKLQFDRGEQPQRAAGGRIGRATGGKAVHDHEREADMLMRRMEAAKKMEGHNTERLLQKDDTVIAKALAKANKDI
jgi:hypothetical protein